MSHVKVGKEGRLCLIVRLPIPQSETKKGHLITVLSPSGGLKMARVVPPLGLKIGMRKMALWER
jgi:hypothetical protein